MKFDIEKIRVCMAKRGWSNGRLARETKMTSSGIGRILSGNRSGSLDFLEGLMHAFPEVDIREFLIVEKAGDADAS